MDPLEFLERLADMFEDSHKGAPAHHACLDCPVLVSKRFLRCAACFHAHNLAYRRTAARQKYRRLHPNAVVVVP